MKKTERIIRDGIFAWLLLLIAVFCPAGCGQKYSAEIDRAFSGFSGDHCIIVDKGMYQLTVYNRKKEMVVTYPISIGLNPDGKSKLFSGDDRTPEGLYHVNEMLSMDAAKDTPAYRKLKGMNEVYFRAKEGHCRFGAPEKDLGTDAYGPRYFGLDYPNEQDRRRYRENVSSGVIKPVRGSVPSIGSGIAIHGNNDPESIGHRASSGCVRMFNRDIVELERYIRLGTPVIIGHF